MKKEVFIQAINFSKSFGTKRVIQNLDLEVYEGEVFAFLGSNGSGKTTTIRCLLGIYTPTEGELLIKGKKFNHGDTSLVGYLPEERGLYLNGKVLETLIYFGRLKKMSFEAAKRSALDYLERVGLSDKIDTKIKSLSSGQQQKIQLGIAVIHSPELLILDEPTKGLDPVNKALLIDVLWDLNKKGTTILFSTHYMDEVEKIAERLVMIKDGRRVLYGELKHIKDEFRENTIIVTSVSKIPENKKLYTIQAHADSVCIIPKAQITSQRILDYLRSQNVKINSFVVSNPSLNDIFIKVSNSHE